MRLGIFGGTFNPIHLGHLRVAEEVRETLELEKILFVPSYLPPHKELDSGVPGGIRLEIVRRAVSSNPFFELSAFEVEQGETPIRSEPSITCDGSTAPRLISFSGRMPSTRS